MRRVRLLVVALVLLVAAGSALALSGRGTDHSRHEARATPTPASGPFAKLPSAEIARQAIADMAELRNFRAQVTLQEDHQVLLIDVRRANGGECFGRVTEGRDKLTIIATEDHMFVRASAAYWREHGSHDVIEDMTREPSKWARFDESETHDLCDVPTLMDKLELDKKTLARLQAKAAAPFQGYTAVTLANHDDTINIVVSVDSPHYILEITYEGEVRFSDFDVPASVRIPRRDEYIPFRDSTVTV